MLLLFTGLCPLVRPQVEGLVSGKSVAINLDPDFRRECKEW